MHRRTAIVCTLLLGVAVGGCDLATAITGRGASARTDATTYMARYLSGEGSYRQYGFDMGVSVRNTGPSNLYLARCFPHDPTPIFAVELLGDGGVWGAGYNVTWGCVGHENPIIVEPDETFSFDLRLVGPTAFDGRTGEPFGTLTGHMRLRIDAQRCTDTGRCRPDRDGIHTNSFEVTISESQTKE